MYSHRWKAQKISCVPFGGYYWSLPPTVRYTRASFACGARSTYTAVYCIGLVVFLNAYSRCQIIILIEIKCFPSPLRALHGMGEARGRRLAGLRRLGRFSLQNRGHHESQGRRRLAHGLPHLLPLQGVDGGEKRRDCQPRYLHTDLLAAYVCDLFSCLVCALVSHTTWWGIHTAAVHTHSRQRYLPPCFFGWLYACT